MERTGDDKADLARWFAQCMNLIEPLLSAVYIVHKNEGGAIVSVHHTLEAATAACESDETVLTWEVS